METSQLFPGAPIALTSLVWELTMPAGTRRGTARLGVAGRVWAAESLAISALFPGLLTALICSCVEWTTRSITNTGTAESGVLVRQAGSTLAARS